MILSRRSLLAGAGAAIIAQPALASGPLIARRPPFAFPGTIPSFDPSHIASGNIRYSGVATGPQFINLLTGQPSVPSGTAPQTGITSIGPSSYNPNTTTYCAVANSFSDSPTWVTMAAIIIPITSSSPAFLFENETTNSATGAGIYLNSLNFGSVAAGVGQTSGITLTVKTPYFVAASFKNGAQNYVVINLATGQIKTATGTATHTPGGGTTPWAIGGVNNTGSYYSNSYIAAVMYSLQQMSMPQLLAWASSPWDFWYPQTTSRLMFSGLAHQSGTVTPKLRSLMGVGL